MRLRRQKGRQQVGSAWWKLREFGHATSCLLSRCTYPLASLLAWLYRANAILKASRERRWLLGLAMAVSRRTRAVHSTLICALGISFALAYIPAQATNRTDLGEGGSSIRIRWSFGSYDVPVSFQLPGSGSLSHSRVSYFRGPAAAPPAYGNCDRAQLSTTASTMPMNLPPIHRSLPSFLVTVISPTRPYRMTSSPWQIRKSVVVPSRCFELRLGLVLERSPLCCILPLLRHA